MVKTGIDVSYAQGVVDWEKVKNSGIDFAIIRIGFCYNDGTLKEDAQFKNNIENAIKAGMDVGIYLYSYAIDAKAARKAAQAVIEKVKPYQLTYPIAFDIEYESIYTAAGKKANNTSICMAFLDEVEKAGYYAMLYCSKDFIDSYLLPENLEKYDKWIAQYSNQCTSKHKFGIWQYTSTARVAGVNGNVDKNYAFKDYPSIIKKMGKNTLYTINVVCYNNTVVGDELFNGLSQRGYFTFRSSKNEICVGKFDSVSEANLTLKDLNKKGYSGSIVEYPN